MSEQILNFNDALSVLDDLSISSFLTEAWVPSLNRTVKLKELTTKQQSTIAENFLDFIENKNTFSKTFSDIIFENCLEDSSVKNNFTIFDRSALAFSIRNQLSEKIKVEFQQNPKIEKEVDISIILENFKSYLHPILEIVKQKINSEIIEIQLEAPKMVLDSSFDDFVYKKVDVDNNLEKIKIIFNNAFLAEIAKHIKEIKINDNLFNYNSLSIDDKIKVVEKLPAVIIQKINGFITKCKSDIEKNYTVNFENLEKIIKIDALMFLIN